ncbi:hypothetical protein HII31_05474 [Pseudocercospora fuligena]|uniref:Ipa protein n=1 Tax=Pseudocercospora fuligena TaxID=685502 RepID=A0A8H6RLE5_9PEZI|nr:hypothetical protein HII31_05474 [Pseudocercospora fuligena]
MTTLTSNMLKPEGDMNIPELQQDLRLKYRNVGGKVQEIWRNFTPKQREAAMRETVGDGKVLKNSRDPGMAGLKRFLPDWNLEDITSTPEFFLDRLKFRVETDLHHQHFEGANGGPGDRQVIEAGARTINVGRHGEFALFVNLGKDYGSWVKPSGAEGRRALEDMAARSGLVVPSNEAYLLISRQTTTYIYYNHLIEEILDIGSESRAKKASSVKKTTSEPAKAMAKLTLAPKPLKASIADVLSQAVEQKVASEAYLDLLRSEPVVLNRAVNMTNNSRPELVSDERGRILPMFTDKFISIAFFEVMCNAVKAIVTWEYIARLIRMLEGDNINDKVKRSLVAQELSNTCHLEYQRAQSAFKRQMSRPFSVAAKSFRRITTGDTSRIALKGQPSDYTASNSHLHYIIRLCHPDTKHTDAAEWIQKLDDHHTRYPDDLERLDEDQVLALGELAIITSFMHTLTTSLTKVAGSKKLGLLFTGRTAELDTELAQYKAAADFGEHLVPTGNLLEPGVASNALQALDEFMVEKAGASLGSLYEDLLHDCLNDVEKMYSDAKLRAEKSEKQKQQSYVPLKTEDPKPANFRAEQRREKAKTRPAGEVRPYSITAIEPVQLETAVVPVVRFKVKASTASVFNTIFDKTHARGSVSWADFAGAMTELGFSVTPKYGSVFTFQPPESWTGSSRSITLHRPHASEIEGYKLLIFSRRLYKTYGWTVETFEVE